MRKNNKKSLFFLKNTFFFKKDKILVFTNFTSLVLISTMVLPLVILFIIKLYAQNNIFKRKHTSFT